MKKLAHVLTSATFFCLVTTSTLPPNDFYCPQICTCSQNKITINCSKGNISAIPPEISTEIQHLDLSVNIFTSIPRDIRSFTNLTTLSFAYNLIEALSKDCFVGLNNLYELDLSYNQLNFWLNLLPSVTFKPLLKLGTLNLSGNMLNGIFELNYDVLISSSLRKLILMKCNINNTNDINALRSMLALKELVISYNPLEVFGGFISKTIEILDISNCRLNRVTQDALKDMTALKSIDASNNNYLRYSKFTPNSNTITKLILENCTISPEQLSGFPYLEELYLSGNQLRTLEDFAFSKNSYLKIIDLSRTGLSFVSRHAFHNLKQVMDISLSKNLLSNLHSDTFSTNFQLKRLNLSHNYFSTVIDFNSKSLLILDMSNCELEFMTGSSLSRLSELKYLYLNHNGLKSLPNDLTSYSLEHLDVSSCRLQSLSNETLHKLTNLRTLKMNNNFFMDEFNRNLFPKHIRTIELYKNPWRCDCTSPVFKNFYDYLVTKPAKCQKDLLICSSPSDKKDSTWSRACETEWYGKPRNSTPSRWMLLVVMLITIIALICIVMVAKKLINDQFDRNRQIEIERQRVAGLERLRHIREQARASNSQLNAPDPRDMQSPPSYEEALLMLPPGQINGIPKTIILASEQVENIEETNESIKSESDSVEVREEDDVNESTRLNSTQLEEHHF